jgi:hypothetical protein
MSVKQDVVTLPTSLDCRENHVRPPGKAPARCCTEVTDDIMGSQVLLPALMGKNSYPCFTDSPGAPAQGSRRLGYRGLPATLEKAADEVSHERLVAWPSRAEDQRQQT